MENFQQNPTSIKYISGSYNTLDICLESKARKGSNNNTIQQYYHVGCSALLVKL